MNTTRTEWKRPPVIEVVLGVQFAPIEALNNGHLGWFWQGMTDDYPKATDSVPIPPTFGDEPDFRFPGIEFGPARGDSRLRMISDDGSRMVQVQNGWLVVNWMKREGKPYPGYTGVLPEFERVFAAFTKFVSSHGLGEVRPNLWEVTYIDHIPRGTVWNGLAEVPKVLPGLLGGCTSPRGQLQSVNGTWSFRLQPQGRLVVLLQTARSAADPPVDLLVVTSTARGPIKDGTTASLVESLNSGRVGVVDTFMAVTSKEARAYWSG